MSGSEEVVVALQGAMEAALSEVNTTVPGTVVSYDAARNRAVVRASLPKRLADGEELPAPLVYEVPVVWPAYSGGAVFTFPIAAGDGVLLHFSQRSLEGWLSGKAEAPDDPRRHDITDAIAVPGLRASGAPIDPTAVVLSMGGAVVRIEPGGIVRITATTLFVEGNVMVTGDVLAGTVSLKTHVHTGVQAGAALSGPPQP